MSYSLIEIYGKPNCIWCKRAKDLVESKNLKYKYYVLDADYTLPELLALVPGARTVPQIFLDGESIGGYMDLEGLLK